MNNRNFGSSLFGSIMPPVIKALLIINVGIYILETFILGFIPMMGTTLDRVFFHYLALQPLFANGLNYIDGNSFGIWQLITYQFMHGGLWHLFFNMFALWMFGMELENRWGSGKFLLYYLLSGIGAGISQIFISPLIGQVGPTVGASGAIYGILLAFGMTFPNRPIFMFPFFIPIPARLFVIIFAGIELFSGFSSNDGVAHFAHLGGALTGLLIILFFSKTSIYQSLEKLTNKLITKKTTNTNATRDFYSQMYEKSEPKSNFFNSWSKPKQESKFEQSIHEARQPKPQTSTRPTITFEGEEITQRRIDEILDKITANGYQSLNEKEKRILTELSKKL